MVTQPVEPTQQALEPTGSGLDFEITDSTSPEQRALEAKALSEADEDSGEVQSPEAEQAPTPAPAETPQPSAQTEPASEPKPPRLEDSPEWRKAQASWQKQVDEAKKRAEAAERRAAEREAKENLEAKVEAELRRQEARHSAQFGEDEARRLARDPENVRLVRDNAEKSQQLEQAQQESRNSAVREGTTHLANFINKLRADHGLDDEDTRALALYVTPSTFTDDASYMATGEAIALAASRFAKAKQTQQQQAIKGRVPPETAATKPENGASPGSAARTPNQELARIRAKPSWEWTEAELKFMRTGRV